jgi:hypothetical protein
MTSTVSARIRALSIISITVFVVLLLLASAGHRRAVIAVIERINGIDAGFLQVGQVIDIPVASS